MHTTHVSVGQGVSQSASRSVGANELDIGVNAWFSSDDAKTSQREHTHHSALLSAALGAELSFTRHINSLLLYILCML